jgi:hypothetical protein
VPGSRHVRAVTPPADSDRPGAVSAPRDDTDASIDADRPSDVEWTLTQELRLEPVQFIARTDAVMRLGAHARRGRLVARVRDSMERAPTRSASRSCTRGSA